MSLDLSTAEAQAAVLAEDLIKKAMTEGLNLALTSAPPMEEYAPPEVADLPRDFHRCLAAALRRALGSLPSPLPIYTVATAPTPSLWTGCQIYVSNGAGGSPIVAFSNGSSWLRCDTGAAISS